MSLTIAILEDNADRLGEMVPCLAELMLESSIAVYECAAEMNRWLETHLSQVDLISLDYDLPMDRDVDHGCGRDVADFLAARAPTCPIIIHSANNDGATGMFWALKRAGWHVERVYPEAELSWVREGWIKTIAGLLHGGWIVGDGG